MKTLINMELSPDEAKELYEPKPGNEPKYPWGLSICLEHAQLEKLGLTTLPKVGSTMSLVARVEVTSTSERESQGDGPQRSVSLQVTDMALSAEAGDAAQALYGAGAASE